MPRLFPWTPTLEKLLPKLKSNDGERAVGMLIWLLEDDESVSRALQRTLRASGYEVEAFAGAQALRDALSRTPLDQIDVLLFDVRLAQDSGLAFWQSIKEQASCPPVVFLSGNAQIHEAVNALKDGAADFLLKPFEQQSLLESLRRVLDWPRGPGSLRDPAESPCPVWLDGLTRREKEVMRLVGQGLRNAEIGQQLGIGLRTVKMHRGNIMAKIGVRNQGQLLKQYFSKTGTASRLHD